MKNISALRESLQNVSNNYDKYIHKQPLISLLSDILDLVEQLPSHLDVLKPGDKVLVRVDKDVNHDIMLVMLEQ